MSELNAVEQYRNLINQAPIPIQEGVDHAVDKAAINGVRLD